MAQRKANCVLEEVLKEVSSPTVTTELVITASIAYTKNDRDVVSMDIPNVFVQTDAPKGNGREEMKIRG